MRIPDGGGWDPWMVPGALSLAGIGYLLGSLFFCSTADPRPIQPSSGFCLRLSASFSQQMCLVPGSGPGTFPRAVRDGCHCMFGVGLRARVLASCL